MYTTTHAILAAIPLLLAFFLMVLRNVSASKSVGISFLLTLLLVLFVWQVAPLNTAAYTIYGILKAVDLLLIVAGAIFLQNTLKKAGLIETREGMGGGYRIAKANSEITLRQISDALENTLVKASWRSGNPDKKCLVASGMSVVMDELVTGMNRSCNDYLERITIQKVEERLTALKEKDNETGGCLSCQ